MKSFKVSTESYGVERTLIIFDYYYNPRQKSWDTKQVLPSPTFNVDNQVTFSLFVGKSDIFQFQHWLGVWEIWDTPEVSQIVLARIVVLYLNKEMEVMFLLIFTDSKQHKAVWTWQSCTAAIHGMVTRDLECPWWHDYCKQASWAKIRGWQGSSIIEPCKSIVQAEKISSDQDTWKVR